MLSKVALKKNLKMDNINLNSSGGGKNMKPIFISVAVVIIAGVALYFYAGMQNKVEQNNENTPESSVTAADIPKLDTDTANIGESVAPAQTTEKMPDLNPINKTNPFKDVYQNPFG